MDNLEIAQERLYDALVAVKEHFGYEPTKYQEDIIDFVINGEGHGIVHGVAGCGKSSTIEQIVISLNAIHEPNKRPQIIVLAFNVPIVKEMTARLPYPNAKVQTLNGLGHGMLFRDSRFKDPKPDEDKTELILRAVTKFDQLNDQQKSEINMLTYPIKQLIALFKNYGFGAIRELPTVDDIFDLADRYSIDMPENKRWEKKLLELVFQVFEAGNKNFKLIDYNDQLYIPVFLKMPFPTLYKYIMVDESQDLNPIQTYMIKKMVGTRNRSLFVGDEWQSIYGFRGADPESMENIGKDFGTTNLPLSVCWRCPRTGIELAKTINPAIEAAPNAKEGVVESKKEAEFLAEATDGDLVLCRTGAPLTGFCMDMIRMGKKAFVKGTDIGRALATLLDTIKKKGYEGDIGIQIRKYREGRVAKIKDEGKLSKLCDRIDTLMVLAEECETAAQVKDKIKAIFSEGRPGICFSTIHKAKGLESDRVWILKPELIPHPMAKKEWEKKQEKHLEYVAYTRHMDSLFFVISERRQTHG